MFLDRWWRGDRKRRRWPSLSALVGPGLKFAAFLVELSHDELARRYSPACMTALETTPMSSGRHPRPSASRRSITCSRLSMS